MVKKQFLVGAGLVALLTIGSFPLLRSAHAQTQEVTAAQAPATSRPVTFEVRDKGVLLNLIHAEGGRDKSTNALRKVTLFTFDASGQVQVVVRADSMEVKQQGERTTWILHNVNLDKLTPQQAKVRANTMTITGTKMLPLSEETAVPDMPPGIAQ